MFPPQQHDRTDLGAKPPALSTSVVVCAYDLGRWDVLREAVEAVLAGSTVPDEVLLVIDHNPELEARCAQGLPADRVRVLANEEARGLSGARNTGVRHARGDVLIFLDDDAVPEFGWLAELLAPYADPGVVGVGGIAAPRWSGPVPRWLPEEFWWVVGCSYRGLPQVPAPVRNPIGANMSFRREAFARAGTFTHGIGRIGATPLGGEETELSIRVLRAHPGSRVMHAPAARVHHLVTPQRATWAYFRSRCWSEGLSKAVVSGQVGSDSALESERSYVLRTLPGGALRGLADAVRGDPSGLGRAGAIVAGLAITAAGYARGRGAMARARRR